MSDSSHPPNPATAPSDTTGIDGPHATAEAPGATADGSGHGTRVAAMPDIAEPGTLSPVWQVITGLTWVGVTLSLAAVWNTSVQLGLSTWWLGPRGEPNPRIVQFAPFVAPALMVLAAINNIRRVAWWGLGSASVLVAVGLGDIGRVTAIAVTEIVIAVAAGLLSAASLTATYRPVPNPSEPAVPDPPT